MKLSAILAPLIAAKAPHELIMAQILAFESEQGDALERRRKADAERQSRKREADKSRDITLRHSDSLLTGASDARREDKPLTQKIEPQENKKDQSAQARDLAEFNAELASLLDADRLKALLKHRRAKRAANTGHAARLFIAAAVRCGLSMPEAVDTCISRNWITIEPDWLAGRNARGSPRKPTLADAFGQIANLAEIENEARRAGSFGSAQPAIPHLSVVSGR